MNLARRTLLFIFIVLSIVVRAAPVVAAPNMQAAIDAHDPLRPVLTLTNTSGVACQVVPSALGTVAITSVKQAGKAIVPTAFDIAFVQGLDKIMADNLKTLKPGESVAIPLRVTDRALESVTWAPAAGAFATRYQVQPGQPLQLEVNYAIPIQVASGAPACGSVAATTTSASPWWQRPAAIVLSALGAALVGILVWWLMRSKRRPILAVILFVCIATLIPAPAHASFTVDPNARQRFDECLTVFHRHADITGEVLDALERPGLDVRIIQQVGPTEAEQIGDQYVIRWDSGDRLPLEANLPSDPCMALFHEMYHHFDRLYGAHSYELCAGSNVRTTEVWATRAENRLRAAENLSQRTMYGTDRLPAGDCAIPPPMRCGDGSRCGGMFGEPHLTTFDGLHYDFQGAGEFIATRDATGKYEIQVRNEPYLNSKQVTTNTAVAMKVHGDRVELDLSQGALVLMVNGKKRSLQQVSLPGGGTITTESSQEAMVTWPDGSTALIEVFGLGLRTAFNPSADKAGALQGLLGNADGNAQNDLALRNNKAVRPLFKELYPAFADSWRVNDRSLFTYAKGKSTASYTDRSFPGQSIDIAKLPNRSAAEALCTAMGVAEGPLLDSCTIDVALTGRPDFAGAAIAQQAINVDIGRPDITLHANTPNAGDIARVTFSGKAGSKVFIDARSTLPDQCGVPILRRPDGSELARGCITGGKGIIDGTVLPVTGTYAVTIDPAADTVGDTELRVSFIADHTQAILPGNADTTITIDRPGVAAYLTFTAQAGQKAQVSITSATYPDQCGAIELLSPAKQRVTTACTLGGVGLIDATALPSTGTYTIKIDPGDYGTGQASVRLKLIN